MSTPTTDELAAMAPAALLHVAVEATRRLDAVRAAVHQLLDAASGSYMPVQGGERRMVTVSALDELLAALGEDEPTQLRQQPLWRARGL